MGVTAAVRRLWGAGSGHGRARTRAARHVYLRRHGAGIIGGLVVLAFVILACAAPLVSPFDPQRQDWELRLKPPSVRPHARGAPPNLLGTDNLGRDILSRIIYGARVSMTVGVVGTSLSAVIGTALGLAAGYYGGALDNVIMRLADVQLAFPFILLVIALVAVLGPSLQTTIMVLGFTGWVTYGRLVRGEVLSLREREFVLAARAIGGSDLHIIVRHLLPNTLNSLIVMGTLQVARLIVAESSLSFLGLGVQPGIPSWGNMLSQGQQYVWTAWWLATFPGMAITLNVLAVNLLGDWLRDLLNPRVDRS